MSELLEKIEVLEKNGLMTDAGLRTIETAKQNGFWTILDEVEDLKVPDDLAMELDKRKNSRVYFESLSKSEKKRLLLWIILAKRPETRRKRIIELVDNANN